VTKVRRPPKKIRVLHILQSLDTGGLENGVVNLANKIDSRRFDLDILCLRYVGRLRDRLRSDIKVEFDSATASSVTKAAQVVASIVKNGAYDIVHTHGWATLLPGFIGGKVLASAKVINGEHGTFFVDSLRRRVIQKLLFRAVTMNCTVSESLKHEMQSLFSVPETRIQVIINGVDTNRFTQNRRDRSNVRSEFGLDHHLLLFGAVGRTVAVKDYNTLLHAFSIIVKDNHSIRLMIVGDGPEDSSLKKLAKSLSIADYVIFTGNRDDVPALLSAMDVFCLSSIREGLSNTLLEAHAAGLPSVATETGGNAEIVKAGITGYLVPVGDVDAMGSAMRCLATDNAKRQELGAAARRRAATRFSLDAMVGNYEKLYERVAACG